jgi:membrane-bound lytic murein transglycosylase MltF
LIVGLLSLLVFQTKVNDKHFKKRDLIEIKQSGILRVVTEYNTNDYYVSGDTIAGLQYELCKYISEQMGLKLEIHLENNLEKCINGLNNNIYDVIARNIPITNKEKEYLSFTLPITQNRQVLVQRKSSANDSVVFINNQLDMAYKTVYVPQNSPVILRLKNLSEEIAEPIYIEEISEYSDEHLMYMVAKGDIDYAVIDKGIATKIQSLFPELDIETDISFTQYQAWAVRKTSPVLLDSLNIWLSDGLSQISWKIQKKIDEN